MGYLKLMILSGATLHKMEEYVPILVGETDLGPGTPKTMPSKKLQDVIQSRPKPS